MASEIQIGAEAPFPQYEVRGLVSRLQSPLEKSLVDHDCAATLSAEVGIRHHGIVAATDMFETRCKVVTHGSLTTLSVAFFGFSLSEVRIITTLSRSINGEQRAHGADGDRLEERMGMFSAGKRSSKVVDKD